MFTLRCIGRIITGINTDVIECIIVNGGKRQRAIFLIFLPGMNVQYVGVSKCAIEGRNVNAPFFLKADIRLCGANR